MFKNRDITVKIGKKVRTEEDEEDYLDDIPFEEKAIVIVKLLEEVAIKAFVGVCIYVVLDTHRQVAVAKAQRPST